MKSSPVMWERQVNLEVAYLWKDKDRDCLSKFIWALATDATCIIDKGLISAGDQNPSAAPGQGWHAYATLAEAEAPQYLPWYFVFFFPISLQLLPRHHNHYCWMVGRPLSGNNCLFFETKWFPFPIATFTVRWGWQIIIFALQCTSWQLTRKVL